MVTEIPSPPPQIKRRLTFSFLLHAAMSQSSQPLHCQFRPLILGLKNVTRGLRMSTAFIQTFAFGPEVVIVQFPTRIGSLRCVSGALRLHVAS